MKALYKRESHYYYPHRKTSKLILLLLISSQIFFVIKNDCIGQQSITWQLLYNSCYIDMGFDICQADGENFYIGSGSIPYSGQQCRGLYLIKINSYGDTIWTRIIDSVGTKAIISSGDGGCVFTSGGYPQSVAKVDADGNLVWKRFYPGPYSPCNDIQRTNDGGYIVCGSQWNTNIDGYAFKIDSMGTLQWQRVYPSLERKDYKSVSEGIGGGYILTGLVYNTAYGDTTKTLITRIDSFGNIIWEKTYLIDTGYTSGNYIKPITTGYIIGGHSSRFYGSYFFYKIYFIKIDINGNILYNKIFSTNESEYFGAMYIINENKYIIAMDRDSTPYVTNGKVIITDSLGNILNQKIFPSEKYLLLNAIQPANNGDLLFVGTWGMHGGNRDDIYALRTDSLLNAPPLIGINNNTNLETKNFKLYSIYPNPFNPIAIIRYDVMERSKITIKIFDILGRELAILTDSYQNHGTYELKWNATNFSSGIYFCSLFIDGKLYKTQRLILNK